MTAYRPSDQIRSVAVIGTGSVGASWTALFLLRGLDVIAHDPGAEAEQRAHDFIRAAWPAMAGMHEICEAEPPLHKLHFVASAAEAAACAELVQENTPELPDLKSRVLAEIDDAAAPDKIILSSTGGLPPSQLQRSCRHPERLVVAHPLNPSHLIPLVEIVGGKETAPEVVAWAMAFAKHLGKWPIQLNAEASGHLTNRLQFALMREAVRCLLEGTASAKDIDAAVRYGLGPRWALMGSLMTLHLAGGQSGMEGILEHAGIAIEDWWAPSAQVNLTPEVRQRLVAASNEVSNGRPVAEWVAWRDEQLVNVLHLQAASRLREPRAIAGDWHE